MTSAQRTVFSTLSDRELIAETRRLAECERDATAAVVAVLMEMDARKLHLGEGCSSLFTYCTQVLHFSEHAAYGRIEAARAARRFPAILEHLVDGRLTLTAIGLLAAHLTPANCEEVLSTAAHKSKREVERIVAAMRPQPAVPSVVRKLAPPRTPGVPAPRAAAPLGGSTRTGSCTDISRADDVPSARRPARTVCATCRSTERSNGRDAARARAI